VGDGDDDQDDAQPELGRSVLSGIGLSLGQFGSCLGEQLALMVSPSQGLVGPIRPPEALLQPHRLLMGADGPLQGLDLMASSRKHTLGIRQPRPIVWIGQLLSALVDLLSPVLELLGTLDRLRDRYLKLVIPGPDRIGGGQP
jgi:hypothetical protein